MALIYDLMLAAVAAAWLVRDPAGLAGWERVALTALFVISVFPPGLAEAWHIPAGPIVAMALLALIAARALGGLSSTEPSWRNFGVTHIARAQALLVPGDID